MVLKFQWDATLKADPKFLTRSGGQECRPSPSSRTGLLPSIVFGLLKPFDNLTCQVHVLRVSSWRT